MESRGCQPTPKQKKRKRAFPHELSHCCHDTQTQTQSFFRCRGSHFIQKDKKQNKRFSFSSEIILLQCK
jgi:hypothetical protein